MSMFDEELPFAPMSDDEFISLMAQTHKTLAELQEARKVTYEMLNTPICIMTDR